MDEDQVNVAKVQLSKDVEAGLAGLCLALLVGGDLGCDKDLSGSNQ